MSLITVEKVTKTYQLGKTQVHAVRGVSMEMDRGDFSCVVGPSGCGKTTLLNMIGCIDSPTTGSITIDGTGTDGLTDNQAADLRLEKLGFIFQSFNLVPVLTAAENVEFPLVLAGKTARQRSRRARELIEAVGLSDAAERKPDELSGGQRQRVAIARALINEPEIVIADEPTANLDSETGEMVLDVMRTLNEDQNVSFLFSTHDPAITRYAKRIVHLKDGLIDKVEEPGASQ